jgi:sporulation protein YlmC with PRC-barrel domain
MKTGILLIVVAVSAVVFATDSVAQKAGSTLVTTTEMREVATGWSAKKQILGKDVYNDTGEKIGDINDLIVAPNRAVSYAIVGVGGFLGMGEHDIAVSMDKLKFVEDQVRTSTATTTKKDATTGTATAPANSTATRRTADANDWVPDHAVMSATKEQLKAMPQFKYSDYN